MSIIDLFKSRRKEELALPDVDAGLPSMPEPAGMHPMSPSPLIQEPQLHAPFPSAQPQPDQQMQLLNAKLDTIKAQLDIVLQKLERMERSDNPQQKWRNT